LANESLILIQINKTHLPILFKWRNESSFVTNCTGRNKIEDIEKFENELKSDFKKDRHLQFLIFWRNKPIGTIFSYSFNQIDKYAFISLFIEKQYANRSLGIKAFSVFSNFLFQEFNLYKIYFDIYEYNFKMISIIEKCQFSIEGVFKNQHLLENKRYDVRRYAFYEKDMQFWANRLKTNTANIMYK
jgi:RimJ/RimL family protein N-acetyltransferase